MGNKKLFIVSKIKNVMVEPKEFLGSLPLKNDSISVTNNRLF
jgi:hypothetical protein